MKKTFVWIVVVAAIVAAVAIRVTRRGSEAPARSIGEIHAEEGVPVDVVTAKEGTITVLRKINGIVSGIRQSTLRASGDYKIGEVLVREGKRVRRGQRLIRYDVDVSPDHMARLDQVTEAYENAKRQFDRLEPLLEAGAIAESDLDAARTMLAVAEADLRNARLELEVVAPIDGLVTLITVRAGDAVESGDVVAQVAVLDSVRVDADVSGEAAREIRAGASIVSTDAGDGHEGRITRVALGADPDTRLFRVEAVIGNGEGLLRPGLVLTLNVVVDRVGPVTVIPQSAVLDDDPLAPGSKHDVFVTANGTAQLRTLTVGRVEENLLEVREGLEKGERVVVFGANRLQNGARIRYHKIDGESTTDAGDKSTGGKGVEGQ